MSKTLSMLISTWQMVVKRSLAQWKLLISVVVGVVLASAITSGTVIYFDALRQLALTTSLDQHSESDLDIILKGTRGPTNTDEYGIVTSLVEREVNSNMASLLRDRIRIGRSATLFLSRECSCSRTPDC